MNAEQFAAAIRPYILEGKRLPPQLNSQVTYMWDDDGSGIAQAVERGEYAVNFEPLSNHTSEVYVQFEDPATPEEWGYIFVTSVSNKVLPTYLN